jgi:hypothetical protein
MAARGTGILAIFRVSVCSLVCILCPCSTCRTVLVFAIRLLGMRSCNALAVGHG